MRIPAPIRATHGSGERQSNRGSGADESSGRGRLRQVLVAAMLFGSAYLAWRRLRSEAPDATQPGDDGPERGHPVPIDGPDDQGRVGGGPADEGSGPGERSTEDEEPGTASAVDPSLEEVDERVEEDVEETPAEPGEVSVSEDVAEAAGEVPEGPGEMGESAGGNASDVGTTGEEPEADGTGGGATEGSTDDAEGDRTDESEE